MGPCSASRSRAAAASSQAMLRCAELGQPRLRSAALHPPPFDFLLGLASLRVKPGLPCVGRKFSCDLGPSPHRRQRPWIFVFECSDYQHDRLQDCGKRWLSLLPTDGLS